MLPSFLVIGISDSHRQFFPPDVLARISRSKVFSGGKRHREILSPFLPPDALWIDVTSPLSSVFEQYLPYDHITVFASGDPLFYGYAVTLQREFPDAEIEVIPAFNSLQLLAHRLKLPCHNMVNVSVTGRPWKGLDDALVANQPLIGCLTDRTKGPAQIAERLLYYGYDNYEMLVGTSLGNEETETVEILTLQEASEKDFSNPNCVILKLVSHRKRYFGIPETEFFHLAGRRNMITKMPVRLLSLSMLDLPQKTSFWDIGFCTGSVSIEARLRFPHLTVTSFEIREESRQIMEDNCRKFGTPSINSIIGDFITTDLDGVPRPDAVFIGGYGGRLREMLQRLKTVILPGCVIVFNSVTTDSCEQFCNFVESIGLKVVATHKMALDSFNPITVIKAQ